MDNDSKAQKVLEGCVCFCVHIFLYSVLLYLVQLLRCGQQRQPLQPEVQLPCSHIVQYKPLKDKEMFRVKINTITLLKQVPPSSTESSLINNKDYLIDLLFLLELGHVDHQTEKRQKALSERGRLTTFGCGVATDCFV